MPTIQPASKVLVTGANGFIAIWVVNTLLEKGYSVRGTVRSSDKGKHLEKTFSKYGDKFEVVVVADITEAGAFDDAVKGVDAVEHTASPFHFKADDPKELIDPAVKGTTGILESVLKHGASVKRVVVTSSCAAIVENDPKPRIFSEADWNNQSIKEVEEKGKDASNPAKYRASKTLAEKAAWDFYNKHKASVKWDLSVINPPYVFGPILHEVAAIDSLNTSANDWANVLLLPDHGGKSHEDLVKISACWVDVRDLAEAHTRVLEKEAAGGERIIICSGPYVWQEWIDAANSLRPSPLPSHDLPKGNPKGAVNPVHLVKYDNSKSIRILGLKYRTKEETARDILADFEAKGW